jgi:subtilase family serine protease
LPAQPISAPPSDQAITPVQFAAAYVPSAVQVQEVVSYLQGAGLTNIVSQLDADLN